ncbi:MMPL family transporter [Planotetraspora sp. A-T 1434]|nr:MMPL family transporter [Planotetraspora sp. A-T 1434]
MTRRAACRTARRASPWGPTAGSATIPEPGKRSRTTASCRCRRGVCGVPEEPCAAHFKSITIDTRFGGFTAMIDQVNTRSTRDIVRAEMIAMPVRLILLVFVFRSAVAAALPLVVGVVAAVGSLAVLRVVSSFADLYTFAVQVVTILGLGLAIDYGLLIVNRFREELAKCLPADDAVERTMATAGRTIAFSGAKVAICFLGLTVFPSRFNLLSLSASFGAIS